jgi:MobA-like NTP transferase domain
VAILRTFFCVNLPDLGPKQLVQFRRKSLVCRIAKAAIEAGCSPVVVVIGSDGEKVARELARTSVTKIENKNWRRGIGSSIRIGMQALIKNGQSSGRAVAITAQANSTLSRPTRDHHSLEASYCWFVISRSWTRIRFEA